MQDEEKPLLLWLWGSGAAETQTYKPDTLLCVLAVAVHPQQWPSQATVLGLVWQPVLVIQALHWNRAPPRQRGWAGNTSSHLSHRRSRPRNESREKQEAFPDTPKEKTECLDGWWALVSSAEHWDMLLGVRIGRGEKRPERHLLTLQASPGHVCVCPSAVSRAATAPSPSLPLIMQYSSASFPLPPLGLLGSNGSSAITHTAPALRPAEHSLGSIRKGDKNWGDWEKPKLWRHPSFEGHSIIFCTGTPGASLLRGLVPGSSHGLLPWFYSSWAQTTGMQCCTGRLCRHHWNCSGFFFSCLRLHAAVVWKGIALNSFAPHLCGERQA